MTNFALSRVFPCVGLAMSSLPSHGWGQHCAGQYLAILFFGETMRSIKSVVLCGIAAAVLVACGGGGNGDQSPRVAIKSVKVMGDSLSDSGTFLTLQGNRVFSVQGTATRVWPEVVASAYGITGLCNVYAFDNTTPFVRNPTAGCTNYAVGGGRINNFNAATGANFTAFSIRKQLSDAATDFTTYAATDLLILDGGGNDAADLVGAYLKAGTDSGASYSAMLKTLLVPATVDTTLATGAAGFASIGSSYMTALADAWFDAIKTNALDKGATHILIANVPAITATPRFQMVLNSVATANGGGTPGATARAASETLFRSWISAFNTQLALRAAGNASVVIADFNGSLDQEIANPAQFGLSNVTDTACPATGMGLDGLPEYTFSSCTDTALSAMTPPAGATGGTNWWKTYLFSDGFHPTPFGHQLTGQLVSKSLIAAGWL